jgi:acyl carrier protein
VAAEREELTQQILAAIKSIICRVAQIDTAALGDDALLFPDLAPDLGIDPEAQDMDTTVYVSLDSLDMLDALAAFEETFGVQYDLNELGAQAVTPDELATPRRIAEYIVDTVDWATLARSLEKRSTA